MDREVPLGLYLNKIAANIFALFPIAIHVAERIGEKDQPQDDKHDEELDQNDEPQRPPQCHATESIHIKAVYII